MAEYSRMASGQVVSTGGATAVVLPFIPNYIDIDNATRASAGSGVTNASWMTDMGQGAAFLSTFGTGAQWIPPVGGSPAASGGLTAGTGFTTIQAGLALQYGALQTIGTTGSITKGSPTLIVTAAAHGLVTGNVVVFQNLFATTTTGMQQIAGIPFVVTVTSTTAFNINWNSSGSNYTTITGSGGALEAAASFKQVLYPALYAPGTAIISAITLGPTTTIVTTAPHNYFVGQEVAFRIPVVKGSPTNWGTTQLNSLPDVIIPGSPIYGYVTSVTNSTTFVVNINSSAYTAFNVNVPFANYPGLTFPQVIAAGDVNTGGFPFSATSQLYPSPTVFNGYTSSTSVGVNTINGPAVQGAFFNATFQGFIIGSAISGSVADVIYWRAYLHDVNF